MAATVFHSWLAVCLLLPGFVHVLLPQLSIYNCAYKPRIKCGDDLCHCCAEFDAPTVATQAFCGEPGMTYLPWLPSSVWLLILANTNMSAYRFTQQFVSNVTHVTHLGLWSIHISHVGPNDLRGFKNLTYLDLTGNARLTMESLRNLLSIPGLHTVVMGWAYLPVLPVSTFHNISSDVTYFQVSQNIAALEYDLSAFCWLANLRHLAISHSSLTDLQTTCILRLQVLECVNGDLNVFPETCTPRNAPLFPDLTELRLSQNNIMKVARACLPKLQILDMSGNKMIITSGFVNLQQFPRLTDFILNDIPVTVFRMMNGTFRSPTLRRLELNGCQIRFGQIVNRQAFTGLLRLSELSLQNNHLELVDDKLFLSFFGHMPLQTLKLSRNKIPLLSIQMFGRFPNLARLELVDCGLTNLPDGAFASLRQLAWLDLSNNKVSKVTEGTFGKHLRRQFRFLGLSRNPFICSCELMWFRNWFVSRPTLFVGEEVRGADYTCSNVGGTNLSHFVMADQACLLSHSLHVAIILVTSAVILTLTAASLLFRFRWHMRLALYEVFRGRGDVRRLRLWANHFDYDVFVSYAREDLPWVRQHLMPELEGRLGLRLCVHERDFVSGQNIVDNIVESVQSSKKVLMVFSKDFVRSQWCQFELTFCLTHVMGYDDTLLILCVDDVTSRDMTPAMMAVLRTTTYIQWGEQGDAVESFWGRVGLALHEVRGAGGQVNVDRARGPHRARELGMAERARPAAADGGDNAAGVSQTTAL